MKTVSVMFPVVLPFLFAIGAVDARGEEAVPEEKGAESKVVDKVVPFRSRPHLVPDGIQEDQLKDAAREAAEAVWKGFVESHPDGLAVTRFAILPFPSDMDGEYLALQLRNQFTEICGPQGLELYTRMDGEWETLLKEIEWGESFADTMDSSTVQKFGRIQGVEALVFPRILGISRTDTEGVKLRANVQVFEIETGRQLWGREVVVDKGGSLVPVAQVPIVKEMKNHRQWIYWGGAVVLGVILLVLIIRAVGRAARPR